MTRGPKPQPGEIKEKKGNPGKRPYVTTDQHVEQHAGEDAVLPEISKDAPDWLSDEGQKVWQALAPDLKQLRFLRSTDQTAFARYCDYFARWLKLRDAVDEDGESYITESRHGTMQRANPDFVLMLRVEDKLQDLEDRFGLTPAARQKLMQQMAAGSGELPLGGTAPVPAENEDMPLGLLQHAAGSQVVN